MTKEEQFVNELIGYIFAYPNDDYMTMECLCRKLHKYGLIEKKDGEWTTDFIDRKTEPTISKMEQVEDEPQTDWKDQMWTEAIEDEPQTCEWCKFYDGENCFSQEPCKVMLYLKTEPTISKMEQVETMSCQECKHFHENAVMYLDQCDFCFKDCKYEPKDEPQTGEMMTEEEFDSMLARVLTGNNEPQTERSE